MKSIGKSCIMAALTAMAVCTSFVSCSDNDDAESILNPAEKEVANTKKHDTALLHFWKYLQ